MSKNLILLSAFSVKRDAFMQSFNTLPQSFNTPPQSLMFFRTLLSDIHFYRFRWWTGAWSLCSRSCDAGTQKRPVYCIENEEEYPVDFNFQHYKIDDQFCFKERKPESVRQCAVEACSKPNTPEKSVLDKVSTSDAYR